MPLSPIDTPASEPRRRDRGVTSAAEGSGDAVYLGDGPEHRLATYGSLAPGRVNAWVLEPLEGDWLAGGFVRGRLHEEGWGAAHGFPGLEWDPAAGAVSVHVLVSRDLPSHWARLDAFEGPDYRRILVPVEGLPGGPLPCHVYVMAER